MTGKKEAIVETRHPGSLYPGLDRWLLNSPLKLKFE